ncbi:hypothetical protein FHG87_019747 [Trinorchestia longiramus]|nr:hypothetical protein FHG87_019747 [Trinorchestia longiramus]
MPVSTQCAPLTVSISFYLSSIHPLLVLRYIDVWTDAQNPVHSLLRQPNFTQGLILSSAQSLLPLTLNCHTASLQITKIKFISEKSKERFPIALRGQKRSSGPLKDRPHSFTTSTYSCTSLGPVQPRSGDNCDQYSPDQRKRGREDEEKERKREDERGREDEEKERKRENEEKERRREDKRGRGGEEGKRTRGVEEREKERGNEEVRKTKRERGNEEVRRTKRE